MLKKYLLRPLAKMIQHDLFEFSGYISYAFLLSFFPFVILLSNTANILGMENLSHMFLTDFYTVLPKQVAEQIVPAAEQISLSHNSTNLITFSTLVTIFSASSGIESIRTALNKVNNTKEHRPIYKRILQNILFVFLSIIGLILIGIFLLIMPVSVKYLVANCPYLCELIHFKYHASFLVIVITFSLTYRFLPYRSLSYKQCLPGSLIAGCLWLFLVYSFSIYIEEFASYNLLYGSLAGIIITLLFIHISSFIMLYGSMLNIVLSKDV